MADKAIDSTQPASEAETEGLTVVTPGKDRDIRIEEVDYDEAPVADAARELPPEIKDAVRQEGTWEGDGDENQADDIQETKGNLRDNG
ncbi:MAG: hypothetical protein AAFO93_07740 [Pseudomonadota bacterium]